MRGGGGGRLQKGAPKSFYPAPSTKVGISPKNPYKTEFYKIEVSSLIEMLELLNFGHVTTSTIWFGSRDKILLVTSWTKIMMS